MSDIDEFPPIFDVEGIATDDRDPLPVTNEAGDNCGSFASVSVNLLKSRFVSSSSVIGESSIKLKD